LSGRVEGSIRFADDTRITTLFFALLVIVAAITFLAVFDNLVTAESALPIWRIIIKNEKGNH
jgi:hypothetical protein